MSDPATYQAYSFRPVKATDANSRRTLVGKARWRISPELDLDDYMAKWESRGYKTGLNILDDQSVVTFSYDDESGGQIVMQASSSPGDKPDLEDTLGRQDRYKWVAFESPPNPLPRKYEKVSGHSVEFTLSLTLSNPRPYRELIGVANRHPGASFNAGSMKSLWVVPVAPFTAP